MQPVGSVLSHSQQNAVVKTPWTPAGKVVKRIDEREHEEELSDEYRMRATDQFILDNMKLM